MRTLVYKRTHIGDPNDQGEFGCNGCMGGVRNWDYDAVIGIGGQSEKPLKWGIARKLTWIGIRPHKASVPGKKYPIVTLAPPCETAERKEAAR